MECLELSKSVLGASNPDSLTSMNNLAALYKRGGKDDLAEKIRADV